MPAVTLVPCIFPLQTVVFALHKQLILMCAASWRCSVQLSVSSEYNYSCPVKTFNFAMWGLLSLPCEDSWHCAVKTFVIVLWRQLLLYCEYSFHCHCALNTVVSVLWRQLSLCCKNSSLCSVNTVVNVLRRRSYLPCANSCIGPVKTVVSALVIAVRVTSRFLGCKSKYEDLDYQVAIYHLLGVHIRKISKYRVKCSRWFVLDY